MLPLKEMGARQISLFLRNLSPSLGGDRGGRTKVRIKKKCEILPKDLSLALSHGEGTSFAEIETDKKIDIITKREICRAPKEIETTVLLLKIVYLKPLLSGKSNSNVRTVYFKGHGVSIPKTGLLFWIWKYGRFLSDLKN